MKKLFGVFCALVCVTGAVRADSLTFRETYKDVIYTYYDEFEGYGYEVFPTIGLSGSGTITIPGLRDRPLNDFEDGSISLGAANLDSVDTIISGNANRLLVRSGFYDDDINGEPVFVEVGRITFVRNGDSLSFTVSFPDVFSEDSAVAAQIAGDDQRGMVAGSIDFRLQLDELEYSRRV